MTDHAYNAEMRHRKENRIERARPMRASGASAALIAREIGVGIDAVRKYLAQGDIDEACKPKASTPRERRACLRCRYNFTPPHAGRFICGECHKTIARMG